jgi:streptogramin lyase
MTSGATGSIEWLAEAPHLAIVVFPTANSKLVNVENAAFPPSLVMAASGGAIWFGDTAVDTVVRIDVATGVKQKITLPDPAAPVTREMIEAARTRDLAVAREQAERDRIEATYRPANVPARLPAFENLVAADGGELWVQGSSIGRAAEGRYVVLSASGTLIARVSVPAGFRITEVGRDYVVGVHRDDDGVEIIRVYALTR